MDYWTIVLISVGGAIVLFFVLYYLYIRFLYGLTRIPFIRRADGLKDIKYFTADDFENIKTRDFSFKSDKNTLRGFIYYKDKLDYKRVIVFFHGYGAGHHAYTKEIIKLVEETSLPVLAFDYTASGISDGKRTGAPEQFLIDGFNLFDFLSGEAKFKNTTFIFGGHSMGGYVAGVLPMFLKDVKVESIFLLAPINSIKRLYMNKLSQSVVFETYIEVRSKRKYKDFANVTLLDAIKKHQIPTLLVHGLKDELISYSLDIEEIVNYANNVQYIRPVIYEKKGHNVYLTRRSEELLNDTINGLRKVQRTKIKSKINEYSQSIDYDKIGEDDEEVFALIKQFIEK